MEEDIQDNPPTGNSGRGNNREYPEQNYLRLVMEEINDDNTLINTFAQQGINQGNNENARPGHGASASDYREPVELPSGIFDYTNTIQYNSQYSFQDIPNTGNVSTNMSESNKQYNPFHTNFNSFNQGSSGGLFRFSGINTTESAQVHPNILRRNNGCWGGLSTIRLRRGTNGEFYQVESSTQVIHAQVASGIANFNMYAGLDFNEFVGDGTNGRARESFPDNIHDANSELLTYDINGAQFSRQEHEYPINIGNIHSEQFGYGRVGFGEINSSELNRSSSSTESASPASSDSSTSHYYLPLRQVNVRRYKNRRNRDSRQQQRGDNDRDSQENRGEQRQAHNIRIGNARSRSDSYGRQETANYQFSFPEPVTPSEYSELTIYVSKAMFAYGTTQGDYLAELLSLRDPHVFSFIGASNYAQTIQKMCTSPFLAEAMILHFDCLQAMVQRNIPDSFIKQLGCVMAIVNLIIHQGSIGEDWTVPVLLEISTDFHIITTTVAQTGCMGANSPILEQAADALLYSFRLCAGQSTTAKWNASTEIGTYILQLILIMKGFNTARPHVYDMGHVAYNRYLSQRVLFERLPFAEDYFNFMFLNCPEEYEQHKRLLLIHLVPLRMARGIMPTQEFLEQFDLPVFLDLSHAIQSGNLIEINRVITQHMLFFVEHGIYRFITYNFGMNRAMVPLNYLQVSHFQAALVRMVVPQGPTGRQHFNFFSFFTQNTVHRLYFAPINMD